MFIKLFTPIFLCPILIKLYSFPKWSRMRGQVRNCYNTPLWCFSLWWEWSNTNGLTRNLTTGQDKILGIKVSLVYFSTWGCLWNSYPALHFLLPYRIIIIITIEICSQRKHQIKDIKKSKTVVKEKACVYEFMRKGEMITTNNLLFQITNTHWGVCTWTK